MELDAASISYQGNHNDKRLQLRARQPAAVSARRPDHRRQPSQQRAGGRVPGSARQGDRSRSPPTALCAGTGFFGIATTAACPNAVPIADNEISSRVPRTNERRPDPLYTTNLLISNDAESWYDGLEIEWDKRLSHGPAVPGGLHVQQERSTRRRRRRSWAPATPTRTARTGSSPRAYSRFHTPHRFTLNGSYRMPFFAGRTDLVGQVLGGWQLSGVVQARLGHAVQRRRYVAGARPRLRRLQRIAGRCCSIRRSSVRTSTDPRHRDAGAAAHGVPQPDVRRHDRRPRCRATRSSRRRHEERRPGAGQELPDAVAGADALSVRIEAFNAFNQVKFGFPVERHHQRRTSAGSPAPPPAYSPRVAAARAALSLLTAADRAFLTGARRCALFP